MEWVDVIENPVGDPEKAELAKRVSYGLYWGTRTSRGIECLVTTTTIDEGEDSGQCGYCIYPKGWVLSVQVVKRARRARGRKKDGGDGSTPVHM